GSKTPNPPSAGRRTRSNASSVGPESARRADSPLAAGAGEALDQAPRAVAREQAADGPDIARREGDEIVECSTRPQRHAPPISVPVREQRSLNLAETEPACRPYIVWPQDGDRRERRPCRRQPGRR